MPEKEHQKGANKIFPLSHRQISQQNHAGRFDKVFKKNPTKTTKQKTQTFFTHRVNKQQNAESVYLFPQQIFL